MTPGTPLSGLDLLIPFIIALAKQSGFTTRLNTIIAIAVYVIWTAVSLAVGWRDVPHATFEQVAANFPAAFAAALATGTVAYQTIWKNILGEQTIEHVTSVAKGPTEDPVVIPEDDAPQAPDPAPAPADPQPADPIQPPPDPLDVTEDPVDDGTPQG